MTIKNVGKSPALDIASEVHQYVMTGSNITIGAAVTKFCSEVRQRQIARGEIGQHGEVLFPGEDLSQSHGVLFNRQEIAASVVSSK